MDQDETGKICFLLGRPFFNWIQVRRTWSERDFSGEVEARLRAWVARHKEELPVYAVA